MARRGLKDALRNIEASGDSSLVGTPDYRNAAQRDYLKEALGTDQYQAASRSTLNAHYTDPAIAEQMWKALQHAGFTGGRVLEPGGGAGTFIGLAPEAAQITLAITDEPPGGAPGGVPTGEVMAAGAVAEL